MRLFPKSSLDLSQEATWMEPLAFRIQGKEFGSTKMSCTMHLPPGPKNNFWGLGVEKQQCH